MEYMTRNEEIRNIKKKNLMEDVYERVKLLEGKHRVMFLCVLGR